MGVEKIHNSRAKVRHTSKSFTDVKSRVCRPKLDRNQSRFSMFTDNEMRNCEMCMKVFRYSGVDVKKPDTLEALQSIMAMCAKLVYNRSKLHSDKKMNELIQLLILDQFKSDSKEVCTHFEAKLESNMSICMNARFEDRCCLETKCASMYVRVSKNLKNGKESICVRKQKKNRHWVMEDGESYLICAILKAHLSVLKWYFDCRKCEL